MFGNFLGVYLHSILGDGVLEKEFDNELMKVVFVYVLEETSFTLAGKSCKSCLEVVKDILKFERRI